LIGRNCISLFLFWLCATEHLIMAILQDILYKVSIRSVHGNTQAEVQHLQIDSREVKKGDAFIAIKGTASDGHRFIGTAIEQGAEVVICEQFPTELKEDITYVQVADSAWAAGYMAHNFYGQPSEQLKLVGVTGTNGKTTIATLLWKLFTSLGYKCGLLSTVQNQVGDQVLPATHTTPDQVSINALLRQMAEAGCTHVFMECSSHAIAQHRIAGLHFMITWIIIKRLMSISG
jgi:UDP-N-acetylmuramoyl-L-alanyl-D-glutamate--2,6-diaminopimelate ligase